MTIHIAESIAQVVASGLCIGCGLCEAASHRKVKMQMSGTGSLRPAPLNGFSAETEQRLLSACPGINVVPRQQAHQPALEPPVPQKFQMDDVWGEFTSMTMGWAADPVVRYKGSTGGVLTSLAIHLLNSKQVSFVYHVKADPEAPMESIATISESTSDVLSGAGSRYGPVAPLTGLLTALERNEPFAIIAKPCDLSAVHNYARHDDRVNRWVTHRLTMVCGGQSTGRKSREVLENAEIEERNVTLYRHRGYGNPGSTRVETVDGKSLEISYQELWKDESSWGIESRCKLCPDALGEAADIAAADAWPGGSPEGEDEGFNSIVVRSAAGEKLIRSAVDAGDLITGDAISVDQLNEFQPHQVRKKIALKARYLGLADADLPVINAPLSRLELLSKNLDSEDQAIERAGTRNRFKRDSGSEDV